MWTWAHRPTSTNKPFPTHARKNECQGSKPNNQHLHGWDRNPKPTTCWCRPRRREEPDYLDYHEEECHPKDRSDGQHALSELTQLGEDERIATETQAYQAEGWRTEVGSEEYTLPSMTEPETHHSSEIGTSTSERTNDVPLDTSTVQEGFSWDRWEDEHTTISGQLEFASAVGDEKETERALLVGISVPQDGPIVLTLDETMDELSKLAYSAGLEVAGSITQKLQSPNPKTFIGKGKVQEMLSSIAHLDIDVVIFDEELSPRQLRNLEKIIARELSKRKVKICDRTNLILDIFSQRARTKEGRLQVDLAQAEYQLPRLTKMWTHLERQQGGAGIRGGMGEKQLEVDKRILRGQVQNLKLELLRVRQHRQLYRTRRAEMQLPVVALVGYTNAGKSTLMNRVANANVLAEDKLFATLDPITRRIQLLNGKVVLMSDTVGFIQKLPTQLIAAFRATLEEISDASILVHVIDVSHPNAKEQAKAVHQLLHELDLDEIPIVHVLNKIDMLENPNSLKDISLSQPNTVCISSQTGEGISDMLSLLEDVLSQQLPEIEALLPYSEGDILGELRSVGMVSSTKYTPEGTLVRARVPTSLCKKLFARGFGKSCTQGGKPVTRSHFTWTAHW